MPSYDGGTWWPVSPILGPLAQEQKIPSERDDDRVEDQPGDLSEEDWHPSLFRMSPARL